METGTAAVKIPAHLQFDQNEMETVVEMVDDKKFRCILLIGDVLTVQHKLAPMYRLGGKVFANSYCLPFKYLARCAITPLQEGMIGVPANLVADNERKNYLGGYVKRNVLLNPTTGERGDLKVGGKGNYISGGLLFKPVFPNYEVAALAHQSDGVVEIDFLSNAKEAVEAQYHYFPDWGAIVQGKGSAFESFGRITFKQLREHLANRQAVASSAVLRQVGDMFLQSCDQYQIWGMDYIQSQVTVIKTAAKLPNVNAKYDEIAERLLTFLEMAREDDLVRNFANAQVQKGNDGGKIDSAMTMLAESQKMMTQILANQQGVTIGDVKPETAPVIQPDDLTAQQAYEESLSESVIEEEVEEEGEKGRKGEGESETDEIVLDDDEEPTEEEKRMGKCSDVNSNHQPCGGKVAKKVSGQIYCAHHPKAPVAGATDGQ